MREAGVTWSNLSRSCHQEGEHHYLQSQEMELDGARPTMSKRPRAMGAKELLCYRPEDKGDGCRWD